ncbi:uncharacterized protein LOC111231489 [Seriola dumerili]|uniref:uncharacterized protein LOC111231489 n=1 Tax=Seriola dumerili TaxID=41447 RepID=UPI000BBE1CF0|nr:uncharacterized protein LOC111231489 [Seriola dumerili]
MQLLCIAALILSAVAAHPDSWRPWEDEKFPPAGGPKQDADSKRGDGAQSVTQAPEGGDGRSSGDWPEGDSGHPVWPDEMPPWLKNRPPTRPGNGNPQGPMKLTDWTNGQMAILPHLPTWGKREAPGFGLEPGRHFGRPRGPPRGKLPNMRNPGATDDTVFSPTFKVDNVAFQNITGVSLKEGENLFLMPKGGRHGPPENVQYVKLIYNTTEPNKVSVEYGVLKPMSLGELVGEEDDPEEAGW